MFSMARFSPEGWHLSLSRPLPALAGPPMRHRGRCGPPNVVLLNSRWRATRAQRHAGRPLSLNVRLHVCRTLAWLPALAGPPMRRRGRTGPRCHSRRSRAGGPRTPAPEMAATAAFRPLSDGIFPCGRSFGRLNERQVVFGGSCLARVSPILLLVARIRLDSKTFAPLIAL